MKHTRPFGNRRAPQFHRMSHALLLKQPWQVAHTWHSHRPRTFFCVAPSTFHAAMPPNIIRIYDEEVFQTLMQFKSRHMGGHHTCWVRAPPGAGHGQDCQKLALEPASNHMRLLSTKSTKCDARGDLARVACALIITCEQKVVCCPSSPTLE